MEGGRSPRYASTTEALHALGPLDAPGFARRVAATGIGRVTVGPTGSVSWSDAVYRWHGRPRWRRVRTVADATTGVTVGVEQLRDAYDRLAAGTGPLEEPVRFVVDGEHGVRHTVQLLLVGARTALVSGVAAGDRAVPDVSARIPAPVAEPVHVTALTRPTPPPPAPPAPPAPPEPPEPQPDPEPPTEVEPEPPETEVEAEETVPEPEPGLAPDDTWRDLFEASPVAMAVLDDGLVELANDALRRLAGRDNHELAGTAYDELVSAGEEGEPLRLEDPDGDRHWVRESRSDVELGGARRELVALEDVTDAHETEVRLRQQALHDELTGLPNRRLLVDQLAQALSRSRRTASKVGVFFIDVDDLKRVNDTHGHGAGDALILTVGRSLRDALRESDTLARIGGDEFVAICEDVGEGRTLDEIGQRIIDSVTRPLVLDGESIPVSISVGVAAAQSAEEDSETLLARADAAMYRAKAGGGGRLWGGTGRWNTAPDPRPGVDEWLQAMDHGQLRLMYEPVVTADDGVLLGVVGKLRWSHPEMGELTGTDLLETRDVGRATAALVRWSVRKALAEVRSLNDSPLTVWLTVPSRALLQASVAEEVATAYADFGGRRAPALVLDVREKDLASLLRRGGPPAPLARFSTAGPVSLGIDGFRGDAVPLGLLAQLAPRSVRLHSSLMRAASRRDDPTGRALLDGIVAAATAAGVTSIAAQVDDLATLQVAREARILAVQGTAVAPARPIDGLTSLLHSRRVALPATRPGRAATFEPESAVDLAVDIGATLAAETGLALPATEPGDDTGFDLPRADVTVDLTTDIGATLAAEIGLTLPDDPRPST